jgi:hypothetical protein
LGQNLPQEIVLSLMLTFCLDEFRDIAEGTCSFDSIVFQKFLEIIKKHAVREVGESQNTEKTYR